MEQKSGPRGSKNEARNGVEIAPKRMQKLGPTWGRNCGQGEAKTMHKMEQKLHSLVSKNEAQHGEKNVPKRNHK